jgi:hypothetical protein
MSRTQRFGIGSGSIYAGPANNAVYIDSATGRMTYGPSLPTALGGTGADTATVPDGLAQVKNGVWTFGTIDPVNIATPYADNDVLTISTAGVLSWTPKGNVTRTVTVVDTSPYDVLATDTTLAIDTRVIPITINLPLITATRVLSIVDSYGTASENNIALRPAAGNTILRNPDDTIIATSNMVVIIQSISSTDWAVLSKD